MSGQWLCLKNDTAAGHQDDNMHTAQDIITTYSRTGTRLREGFFKARASLVQQAALHMARSLARDGRILILGEGAADSCARTVARAFLDRLDLDRPALPAFLIPAGDLREQGADRAALRQLEALARAGDTLLSFLPDPAQTTMGPVLALAQETGLSCIALCGRPAAGLSLPGLVIDVPDASGAPASLVHELLFAAGHLVCRLVDHYLFENVTAIQAVDPQ